MAWFRKSSRRVDLGTFIEPATRPLLAVDELVEEGLLIAGSAVRLAVKNRLILASLREGLNYDGELYIQAVRDELQVLADEKEADAVRADSERELAKQRPGLPQTFHDYRRGDVSALDRRGEYSRLLASRLRELADDEDFARRTAEQAHEAAWDEIAASVKAKLLREARLSDEPDYLIERQDRLRELTRDLKRLGREAR